MSEQSQDPRDAAASERDDAGGRRCTSPPRIVTHAPEGLPDRPSGTGLKRSEWIAIGTLGASIIATFAIAEGVNRVNRCTPEPNPTSAAIVRADTNCSSSSFHATRSFVGGSATEEAHFGGFGKAGSAHAGGFGE